MFATIRLKLVQQQLLATETMWAFGALGLGVIAISFAPIFISLSEGELGPNATIFNRFWVATVTLGLWNGVSIVRGRLFDKQSIKPQPYSIETLGLLLAAGIVISVALILWAWSLTKTSVANSTFMHYLTPLFVILGGWLIWGRRFDKRFILGMVIAIAGAGILVVKDFASAGDKLTGDLAALLSAFFCALYPLFVEQLRTKENSIIIITWVSAIASGLLLPVVIFTEDRLFPYTISGWVSVMGLALLCQVLGLVLFAYSLKRLSSGFTSLSSLLVPVLSSLEAWVIFSETIDGYTVVSFVVILLGGYLAVSSKSAIKV